MVLKVRVDDNGVGRALGYLADDLDDPTSALQSIADEGARVAASEAPRRTGRLAGGNVGRVRRGAGGGEAVVENAVPYAGYVDRGTRRTSANPFLSDRTDQQLEPFAVRELDQYTDTRINLRGLA